MTNTRWNPDTCDCIIIYNQRIIWVESVKNCRLHKNLKGQNHLDTVLAQNQRFNSAIQNPTEADFDETNLSKDVNKLRIRKENLDNFHEHLPEHHDLPFFENLKRILRTAIRI